MRENEEVVQIGKFEVNRWTEGSGEAKTYFYGLDHSDFKEFTIKLAKDFVADMEFLKNTIVIGEAESYEAGLLFEQKFNEIQTLVVELKELVAK